MVKSPLKFQDPKPLFEVYYWSRGRIAPVLPSEVVKTSPIKGALRRQKPSHMVAGNAGETSVHRHGGYPQPADALPVH